MFHVERIWLKGRVMVSNDVFVRLAALDMKVERLEGSLEDFDRSSSATYENLREVVRNISTELSGFRARVDARLDRHDQALEDLSADMVGLRGDVYAVRFGQNAAKDLYGGVKDRPELSEFERLMLRFFMLHFKSRGSYCSEVERELYRDVKKVLGDAGHED